MGLSHIVARLLERFRISFGRRVHVWAAVIFAGKVQTETKMHNTGCFRQAMMERRSLFVAVIRLSTYENDCRTLSLGNRNTSLSLVPININVPFHSLSDTLEDTG